APSGPVPRRLATAPKGDQAGGRGQDRGDQSAHVSTDVIAGRKRVNRAGGQLVSLRLVHEQEESVQAAVNGVVTPIEIGRGVALAVEGGKTRIGGRLQLVEVTELNRLGRAGLGAGGLHAGLQPVVAEGALPRGPGVLVE